MNGMPTIGGPVSDFQSLHCNGQCPGSAAAADCYCGTWADSPRDYTVTVIAVDGAAKEIDVHRLDKKQTWDVDFTFGTCHVFMGRA